MAQNWLKRHRIDSNAGGGSTLGNGTFKLLTCFYLKSVFPSCITVFPGTQTDRFSNTGGGSSLENGTL